MQSQIPVVYLTAHADEPTIHRARETEPFGYIIKPFEERELRTVIEMALYKHQAESRLRASERRYHTTLASIADAVIATDAVGRITFLNPVAEALTGWRLEEASGRPLEEVFQLREAARGSIGSVLTTRDGCEVPIEDSAAPIHDDEGQVTGTVLVFRDVSQKQLADQQRRQLEAQMLQSQKLESLGLLAGGIAHDFNNLLTGILGYTNLAAFQLPPDSPASSLLREAEKAAHRAAELVRPLLAYAGKGRFVTQAIDLNALVQEMLVLLQTLISHKAILRTEFASEVLCIDADVAQVRQVVMNLITNASESLQDREGILTLRTGSIQIEDPRSYSSHATPDAPPGEYVFFEVSDTGCGMTPDVLSRIFDPFFTTKFSGRGLGLAAVQGIIHGHRGILRISSVPDQGSQFQVLFPRSGSPVAAPKTSILSPEVAALFRGQSQGSILVVDDEETVRILAQRILQEAGFQVVVAEDGEEAVTAFRVARTTIQMVLIDLTMPGLDGLEATRAIYRLRDDVPVILMSGYGEPHVLSHLADLRFAAFLQKPFVAETLLRTLHQVLQGK
jgi:PAS domain S-box-containing protein